MENLRKPLISLIFPKRLSFGSSMSGCARYEGQRRPFGGAQRGAAGRPKRHHCQEREPINSLGRRSVGSRFSLHKDSRTLACLRVLARFTGFCPTQRMGGFSGAKRDWFLAFFGLRISRVPFVVFSILHAFIDAF